MTVASTSGASDRESSDALQALLGLLPDAAVLVTAAGAILGLNAGASAALGLGPRAVGASLPELTADPEAVRAFLRLCSRTREPTPGALVLGASGERTFYTAVGALVRPRSESSPSTLAVRFWAREAGSPFILLTQKVAELNEEVKRRRDAEDALRANELRLRERTADLERASMMKDEFLATVSHELRTPLNAILGWSVVLRSRPHDAEAMQRAIETIERNARAQAHIVDDLLDVSRIVSGQVRLAVRQFDPIEPIEAAIDAVRPAADGRAIRLQPTLDPGAGPIMGDPARIQQVLWNLLSNAVKFTPKGGRVQVLLRNVDSAVEIEVIDTGTGIRADFLPHVFAPFRQQDGSTTRRHGGLGLGLAIARNLVELHGGTIEAFSEGEDKGTRMKVRLPRAALRVSEPERRPRGAGTSMPALPLPPQIAGRTVLVVDDEPDSRALVVTLLEHCGATVLAAASAAEALAMITTLRPDVLVSDVGMPDMDGHELVRRVRGLDPELGGRVPAVALTAYARSEDRTRALEAGFHAHVAKPVEPRELLTVLARILDRH